MSMHSGYAEEGDDGGGSGNNWNYETTAPSSSQKITASIPTHILTGQTVSKH